MHDESNDYANEEDSDLHESDHGEEEVQREDLELNDYLI